MATTSEHRNRKQKVAGLPFLAFAAVLFAIGLVIALIAEGGLTDGIGAFFMIASALPAVVGLGLLGSALVEKRSREGKPFA
jgi:high-affinity Fe2+/Pb2+ permease